MNESRKQGVWYHVPIHETTDRWMWGPTHTRIIRYPGPGKKWILRAGSNFADIELPDDMSLDDLKALALTLWRVSQ